MTGLNSDARGLIGLLNTAQVHHDIKIHPQTRTTFTVITSVRFYGFWQLPILFFHM